MKNSSILLLLLSFQLLTSLKAQEYSSQLSSLTNLPLSGDSVFRQQVDYFPPGEIGTDIIWDFSEVEPTEDGHYLYFKLDSASNYLLGLEPYLRNKYLAAGDTLKLQGYETSLQSMSYNSPLALLTFPQRYGDHTVQPLEGYGTYCNKYITEIHGTLEHEADATGSINLGEGDTLRSVIRLHRIYSSSIRQHLPTDTITDSLNLKQRIEEQYLWYARGYRYPVFETRSITIFNNLTPVSCSQTAYRTLPSEQILEHDSINRSIQQSDSLEISSKEVPPIIHYHTTVTENQIVISYSLDADATINVLVCDRMGMVYRHTSASSVAGSSGTISISHSGLRSGIYILYLNVNGTVYTEKIEIQ